MQAIYSRSVLNMNGSAVSYMLIATINIALSTFFAKLSLSYFSVGLSVFSRFFIPFLFLMIMLFLFKKQSEIKNANIRIHFLRGIFLTLSQCSLFYSMHELSLSQAMLLYNTGPIFMVIFSIMRNKFPGWLSIFGLVLGAFGVLVILHPNHSGEAKFLLMGLLSGLFLAISQIMLHDASKKDSNFCVMLFIYFFTSLFSAILLLIDWKTKVLSPWHFHMSLEGMILLILIGTASMSNQFFRGKAYRLVDNVSVLAPLIYISILVSVILDLIYFSALPNEPTIIGGVLIMSGAYVSTFKKKINLFNIKEKKHA